MSIVLKWYVNFAIFKLNDVKRGFLFEITFKKNKSSI